MIRILYITRSRLAFSRAYAQNIIKTAEYLTCQPNIEVEVISVAPENHSKEEIFISKRVVYPFALDITEKKRSVWTVVFARRSTFDVLYFRDPFLWHISLFARFILRKKTVFEVHGSYEWWWWVPFWHLAVRSASGLVYITRALEQFYGLKKLSLVTHCNAVVPQDYESIPEKEVLRKQLALPLDKFIILYAGSLLFISYNVLFSMMRLLRKDSVLVMVGAREDVSRDLQNQAIDASLAGRMISVPRVRFKDVPQYLCAADVLLNPAPLDYPSSISSKLYEYLAAGKPIVSSSGGHANKEILEDGCNALIAEPPTAENFASAITRVMEDKNLAKCLSLNARESSRRYTWEKRVEDIATLITRL